MGFRPFAFLFGVFYYFAKGMWEKGLLLAISFSLLDIGLSIFDVPLSWYSLAWIGYAVVCGQLATTDYYKKIQSNEKVWPFLAGTLPKRLMSIPVLSILLVLLWGSSLNLYDDATFPSCGDKNVTDLVQQMFVEETEVSVEKLHLVRLLERNEQTGAYSCDAELMSSDGQQWDITYEISHDETDSSGYVVRAEWIPR